VGALVTFGKNAYYLVCVQKLDFHLINVFCVVIVVKNIGYYV